MNTPISQMSKEERMRRALENPVSAQRSLVKSSLYYALQYFWKEISPEREFQPNWHLRDVICPELEFLARNVAAGKPKPYDLIINVPPGTTKTKTVMVVFPVWCWINWYWMSFMAASYAESVALSSAEESRDLVRSESFQKLFPELEIKQDKDTKSNFKIVKTHQVKPGYIPRRKLGGFRLSTSVTGSSTGFHAHFNLVDDPIDPHRSVSDKERATANHFMEQTLPHRKIDRKISPTVLIMQRLHQDDPTGRLLELRGDKIRHICLPGEIKNYAEMVNPPELKKYYTADGLLEPNRLGWDALNDVYSYGQYTYASQVGQNPVPLGGGMFKCDRIQVIDVMPSPVNIVNTVRYWDKAGTEGGGSYTVGIKMHSLQDGRFIISDVKRGRWDSEVREQIIRSTAEADGHEVTVYVEQEPGSGGKESAKYTIRNLAGYAIYADPPQGNKPYRADPFSVQVNEGRVAMMRADWNAAFKDELRYFPFGTYNDQVDAASGVFKKLTQKKRAARIT